MRTNYRTLLRMFFEDRDGDWTDAPRFEATAPDGTIHIFDGPALIDLVNAAPDHEQEHIWPVIQQLDVRARSHKEFYDYFQFLADAYARTQ